MKANHYIFRAAKNPTNKELHCLWATLTDKAHVNNPLELFKVYSSGKVVNIITTRFVPTDTVALNTNEFVFLRKEEKHSTSYNVGDFVTLQGDISYSVHHRTTLKDQCPIDALGRIKPQLKEAFLRYLEKATGLDVSTANMQFTWDDRAAGPDRGKVWFNDVISMSITGKVVNPQIFNNLEISAIGRRRSYGFGSLFVTSASTDNAD